MTDANPQLAPSPDSMGQDSVSGPQQGGGAVPAIGNGAGGAEAATPTREVLPQVNTMQELIDRGFDMDGFLNGEDFDHAVIALTTWVRDTGRVLATWGLWQQLMKSLSDAFPDSAPARRDLELSRKLSLVRIRAHEIVYGKLWRRGFVSQEQFRVL